MSSPIPISSSSLKPFFTRLSASLRQALSNGRPWTELIDRSNFSKPQSLAEAASRVRKNVNYFLVNYLSLLALVFAVSLISHPFTLLTLVCLVAAWLLLYALRPSDQPLVFMGRSFSERETLGMLIVVSVVVIFLTSVGSFLMSTAMVGIAIICAHGAFRVPEDLFMDEQETLGSGLFSIFAGNASSAAASSVMPRV